MPIAVIAVSMLVMLVAATPSEASPSCMSKTEARQHFGSVHIYWHGRDHCWDATPTRRYHQINRVQRKIRIQEVQEKTDQPNWHDSMSKMLPDDEPVQTPWVARWANIEPSEPPIVARWVDIVQVAPPPVIEREPEPMVTPRGVVLVFLAIVLTLGTIEILFRCTIYEGRHSRRKTWSAE
jgi:hypothetical protein